MVKQVNTKQIYKDYIQTTLSSNFTVTPTGTIIPMTTTSFSSGTKLTRSGSTIVIGAGVSRIKFSYGVMVENGASAGWIYTRVYVNNSSLEEQLDGISTGGYAATSDSKMLNVSPGDVITLRIQCNASTALMPTSRTPHLLVEVVE